jgi:MFS family permease
MWEQLAIVWNYPLYAMSDGATITVRQVLLVVVVLVVGFLMSRWVQRIVGRRLETTKLHPDAANVIQRVVFFSLVITVAMTALALLHVPLTAFAFISGAVAIGVGFGAQNIINNFISGWILMSERPVRIGEEHRQPVHANPAGRRRAHARSQQPDSRENGRQLDADRQTDQKHYPGWRRIRISRETRC